MRTGRGGSPDAWVLCQRVEGGEGRGSWEPGSFLTFSPSPPSHRMQEWARREAERLVRQREAQGLPVLDPNYYDPKTLVFPPQDED